MTQEHSIRLKELVIGMLQIASCAATFWFWSSSAIPAIIAGRFNDIGMLLIPVAGLIATGALFALCAMFITTPWVAYASVLISGAVPYVYTDATNAAVAVLMLTLLCMVIALRNIRREFWLSAGFSITKIVKSGLAMYFTAAALTISVLYAAGLDEKNSFALIVPKSAFRAAMDYALDSEFARSITGLPRLDSTVTADELLNMMIREQSKNQGGAAIPENELARLRRLQHEEISRQYSITFQGNERLPDLFYRVAAQRTQDLLGPYRKYVPFLSALTFFFAFKALTLPLYLISLLALHVLIKLMLFAKILERSSEKIEVERITFS